MNCLECRRELLVDPRNDSVDLISHIDNCEACSRERGKLLALENNLESCLDYAVPAGLEDRLLEISRDVSSSSRSGSSPSSGRVWQMAASLVLGIGLVVYLGLNQLNPLSNAYALEMTVMNHINDEVHKLHVSNEVSEQTLDNIMTAIKTRASGDIGNVNSASKCHIRKQAGAHLIVNGKKGPVTVLVMPGEHIDKDVSISSKRFDGAIYPTDYGSLAVVGEKGEQIPPIAEKMLQNIVPASS
jgi:hypothetical protein